MGWLVRGFVVFVLTLLGATFLTSALFAQFPVDGIHFRFEAGEGADVVDDVTGDALGFFDGSGEAYSADTPSIEGVPQNDFSADLLGGGFIRIIDLPWIFHDVAVGGAEGDASIEYYFKLSDQGHSAVFWSNADDNTDTNRYNYFWNASFLGTQGSERYLGCDKRPLAGNDEQPLAFGNDNPLATDVWLHVVNTREIIDDTSEQWRTYINCEESVGHASVTSIDEPTALTWLIGGRSGGPGARMLFDEFRAVPRVLTQEEFRCLSTEDCPPTGDTHCVALEITPQLPGDPPPAGRFDLLLDVADDSGDQNLTYSFRAENEFGDVVLGGPTTDNFITLLLTEGTWTVTGSADDDAACPDVANDAECTEEIEVGPGSGFPEDGILMRFEEAEGLDVIDDVSGDPIGLFEGGDLYSAETAPLESGQPNDFCADLTAGNFLRINSLPWIFHDFAVGGAVGDASVECLVKIGEQGHSAIFWSNADDNADQNRYNFFYNANFLGSPSSDRNIGCDRRPLNANDEQPIRFTNEHPINNDTWFQMALVRTDLGGDLFDWRTFYDGEEQIGHASTTSTREPSAVTWLVGGRSGGPGCRMLIDEIRAVPFALDPDDMNLIESDPCPVEGDTHCSGIDIVSAGGDKSAGRFEVTVTGIDDSGDANLTFTFTAESEFFDFIGPIITMENSTSFTLGEGFWTITVAVDDDVRCDDEANDAMCVDDVEVGPPPGYADEVYFRFEEDGVGDEIVEENTGDPFGTLRDGAILSDDVPVGVIPQTGEENVFSADFNAGFGLVDAVPYIHNDPASGAAIGDATTEFWIKIPTDHGHAPFLWSNGDDGTDTNRYNMFFNASFLGAPGSERFMAADCRGPGGPDFQVGTFDNGLEVPIDQWFHVAIVRSLVAFGGAGDGGGAGPPDGGEFEWNWYFDGDISEGHRGSSPTSGLPTATSFLLCGRSGGHGLGCLMDEFRMTNGALTPNEFLNATGEPCEPTAATEVNCEDGNDDDCDGLVDAADPDCDTDSVGPFLRGDCDNNGSVGGSPTEAIVLLNFAFRGGPAPACVAACDAEANGSIGITDALRILRHAFLGVGEPDAPFPDCVASAIGTDIELGCENPLCP